ncbi:uncharacterized protein LOC115883382, partial [Sitophilus oryzae]|uniref:Uncharacterized protein LOC115883382 n=1 Tax=Sitophilus oryzae TaxID=7048 RepID=A0A6J2Y1F2_SITOR
MGAIPLPPSERQPNGNVRLRRPASFSVKEVVPPRHRRRKKRDEEAGSRTGHTNGQSSAQTQTQSSQVVKSQFDFVDEAFPPLPGLDANGPLSAKHHHHHNQHTHQAQQTQSHAEGSTQTISNHAPVGVVAAAPEPATVGGGGGGGGAAGAAWGENRLADVVKGVAKIKVRGEGLGKDVAIGGGDNEISLTSSAKEQSVEKVDEGSIAEVNSFIGVTPPESPQNFSSKSVIATVPTKCTMADKSTKTDDVLLNGCEPELAPLCPTTTNAATMTTV